MTAVDTTVGTAGGTRPAARVRRATPSSWVGLVVGVAILGWALMTATGDDRAWQLKLTDLCVYVVLASMWNLLAGYTGLVSIGQQAFVGLGAYGLVVVSNELSQDIYFSVIPAGLVALVVSIPLGFLAFRLRGGYFAIGTWVIAEVVRLVVKNNTSDAIRGGQGTSLDVKGYEAADRIATTSLVAVVVAVAAIAAVYLVLRSRLGLALQAVRDNEAGARGLGTNVYRTRFTIWLLAAFFTGLAGGVFYLKQLNVQPDAAFSVSAWTAPIIVMVVFGGFGTVEGPIIGAVAYYLLRDWVQDNDWLSEPSFLIVTGLVAVVCALFLQGGIWGTLTHRFPQLHLFPVRRRLVVEHVAEGVRDDRRAT
jgi:branched-chain amino acid transport system permease protein